MKVIVSIHINGIAHCLKCIKLISTYIIDKREALIGIPNKVKASAKPSAKKL
jgi:hypothetical protein